MSLGPAEEFFSEPGDVPDRCSECGREPREDEEALGEWRVESDRGDHPHTFCPECWDREFGEGRFD